jgi:hypothetical protein
MVDTSHSEVSDAPRSAVGEMAESCRMRRSPTTERINLLHRPLHLPLHLPRFGGVVSLTCRISWLWCC